MPNFGSFNPFSPSHNINNSPCSPYNLNELANYANIGSPMYGHNPPTPGGYPTSLSPVAMTPPVFPTAWMVPSPQPRPGQFHFPTLTQNPAQVMFKNHGSWNREFPLWFLCPYCLIICLLLSFYWGIFFYSASALVLCYDILTHFCIKWKKNPWRIQGIV